MEKQEGVEWRADKEWRAVNTASAKHSQLSRGTAG